MQVEHKVQPLITIGIPTYNRDVYLERLLNTIIPQAMNYKDKVEICISNNNSTDNTEEIVNKFKEKYNFQIKYNKNDSNLGFGRNLLKIFDMAEGKFVWLFGDDDQMPDNGLTTIITFIEENDDSNNIGMIIGGRESYYIDKKAGKRVVYSTTIYNSKPEIYEISREQVLKKDFPDFSFISSEIFNTYFIKQTINKYNRIIAQECSSSYLQVLLYRLMFLDYNLLKCFRVNKLTVLQELNQYKFFIDDRLKLNLESTKLDNLISKIIDFKSDKDKNLLYLKNYLGKRYSLKKCIYNLLIYRAFNFYNYSSFYECINFFLNNFSYLEGIFIVFVFSYLHIVPPLLLKNVLKEHYKIKFGNSWKDEWNELNIVYSLKYTKQTKSSRRLIF